MRAFVVVGFFMCACSSASTATAPSDSAADTSTKDAACATDVDPSGGIAPSCPLTSDRVAGYCGTVTSFVSRVDCPHLDAFTLGFGIDTAKECFYDRATGKLVGVLSSVNTRDECWGTIEDDCTAGEVLCAPDASTPP